MDGSRVAYASGGKVRVWDTATDGTVATEQQLDLVTSSGLSSLSGGPDAVVSEAVDGGLIAVLRTSPWAASNSVGIYSHKEDATLNPHDNGPGKLVFVPTAKLLALAG